MLNKIRLAFSREHRAEREARRVANREANAEFRIEQASDPQLGAIREGLRRDRR